LIKESNALNLDVRAAFPKVAKAIAEVDHSIHPQLANVLDAVRHVFDREVRRMIIEPIQ
jgi:hypothetical protein